MPFPSHAFFGLPLLAHHPVVHREVPQSPVRFDGVGVPPITVEQPVTEFQNLPQEQEQLQQQLQEQEQKQEQERQSTTQHRQRGRGTSDGRLIPA